MERWLIMKLSKKLFEGVNDSGRYNPISDLFVLSMLSQRTPINIDYCNKILADRKPCDMSPEQIRELTRMHLIEDIKQCEENYDSKIWSQWERIQKRNHLSYEDIAEIQGDVIAEVNPLSC